MRHVFIINPRAGKRDQTARFYAMAEALRTRHGLDCTCMLTDRPGSGTALARQLTEAGCDERRKLPFHQMLLNGELPQSIGGGIGQSRLCMLLIGTCHIGEVQASIWDSETMKKCEEAGIILL